MSSSQNFSDNSDLNKCLRCGYEWRSNKIMGHPALIPPVRCARCRSPLWNTPRQNKMVKRAQEKERAREVEQLTWDRDGYERLYLQEKEGRQRLEAEVERLNAMLKKDGEMFEELEMELRDQERQQYYREKFDAALAALREHSPASR